MALSSHARCIAALFVGAVLVLTACQAGSSGRSGSRVLNTAITADLSPLDPDTYYEALGEPIMQATYQTLVTYAPDTTEIVPLLATTWKVSSDGLTYTFNLRKGVQFSDGSKFDAAAAQSSFERRTALKAGPSYMTADIKGYETPDPYTLVIKMKQPEAPFLDYLASPYGPMMTSPTSVKAHAVNGDRGSKWLGTHSAGTGPYILDSVQPAVAYTLKSNPKYWGSQPYYTTVNFRVVPNPEQAVLQLQNGQLDFVFGGTLTTRELASLSKSPDLTVQRFPSLLKQEVLINPKSRVFGTPEMRAALRAGLDNESLTKTVWGDSATPSTDVLPAGMLPKGAAPDRPVYDPSKLKNALAPYRGKTIVIGWDTQFDSQQTLANQIQVELQSFGLTTTVRAYPPAELFTLPTTPSRRPDLFVDRFNPDAAAPDTWFRIYQYKDAPVNLLGCTSPEGDSALDAALREPTREAAQNLEVEAANAYRDSNCFLGISDVSDTLVVKQSIAGFVHELPWVITTDLATLRPAKVSG